MISGLSDPELILPGSDSEKPIYIIGSIKAMSYFNDTSTSTEDTQELFFLERKSATFFF